MKSNLLPMPTADPPHGLIATVKNSEPGDGSGVAANALPLSYPVTTSG